MCLLVYMLFIYYQLLGTHNIYLHCGVVPLVFYTTHLTIQFCDI